MIEIDLLAAGRRHLMVVEAKRRLNSEKIREFVERSNGVRAIVDKHGLLGGWGGIQRSLRILIPDGWYHVLSRGTRPASLIRHNPDRRRFPSLVS